MQVAYIVSSSFSGSTLLSLILNAHPTIGTISEFNDMDAIARSPDFRCSCGNKIRECPFFLRLRDGVRNKGVPFEIDNMDLMLRLSDNPRLNSALCGKLPSLNSPLAETCRDNFVDLIPRFRREKDRIYRRNEVMMQTVLDLQNASIFLDANKNPYRMRFLSRRFDVKALYLFKNGLAGVYSYLKSASRIGRPRIVEKSTCRWFEEQISIAHCLAKLGKGNFIQIAYSDLCRDPAGTIQRITNFLEIESLPLDNYAKVPHHIIGNAMRLGDFSEIRERLDWKEKLSEAEIEEYRRAARKCLPRLRAVNPSVIDHLWL